MRLLILASAGACETVPLLLQSHPNNEHVAGAGCDVISVSCSPFFSTSF